MKCVKVKLFAVWLLRKSVEVLGFLFFGLLAKCGDCCLVTEKVWTISLFISWLLIKCGKIT